MLYFLGLFSKCSISTIGKLILVLVVLMTLRATYNLGCQTSEKKWQQRWNGRDKADLLIKIEQQKNLKTQNIRRQTEINKITQNAKDKVTDAINDTTVANDAINRLQYTIEKLQQQYNSSANHYSCSTRAGSTRSATNILYAQLLKESLERNKKLAAEADRRRIAGLTCEQAYDALKK